MQAMIYLLTSIIVPVAIIALVVTNGPRCPHCGSRDVASNLCRGKSWCVRCKRWIDD